MNTRLFSRFASSRRLGSACCPRPFLTASFQYRAMGEERVTSFAATPVAPDLIPSLRQPVQQVLWIGCADSGFHETTILDLLRDEMMVHRNLGNMIVDGDLSCETAVKYAVSVLQVRHIIVCGHYGCRLVKASSREGLMGPWLNKLDSLHATHKHNIDQLPTSDRDRAFVELNVLEQLRSLRSFAEVASAADSGALQLHGLVYDAHAGTASRLLEAH